MIVVTISAAISVNPGLETICTNHSTMHFSKIISPPAPTRRGKMGTDTDSGIFKGRFSTYFQVTVQEYN